MFFLFYAFLFMFWQTSCMNSSKEITLSESRLTIMRQLESALKQDNLDAIASLYQRHKNLSDNEKKRNLENIDFIKLSELLDDKKTFQNARLQAINGGLRENQAAYGSIACLYTISLFFLREFALKSDNQIMPYVIDSIMILGAIAYGRAYHFARYPNIKIKKRMHLIEKYVDLLKKEKELLAHKTV